MKRYDLVVIGASFGGLNALTAVIGRLPAGFAGAVAIAQHRGADQPELLAHLPDRRCALPVRDAEDKDPLCPGRAYLAPAEYHLLVEAGWLALSKEIAVHHSRPAIDPLFESAADAYRDRAIGVVLTGANSDGAAGLAAVGRRGGFTIVQDPDQAQRREMPDAAIAAATPDAIVGLDEIAPLLVELVGAEGEDGGRRPRA